MIIYKATNIITGKSYIGQTIYPIKKRKNEHLWNSNNGSNTYFYKSIRKHGKQSFKWSVLCECETKTELDEMEFHYIKQYGMSGGVYNLTDGGDGSHGRIISKITKDRISKANKGKVRSDSFRKALSIMNTGNKNPNFGNKMSDASKQRISIANKGKVCSDELKERYSNKFKGDGNPCARPCTLKSPDGVIYTATTRKELCDRFSLNRGCISSVMTGKRKSHKGWTKG